LAVPARSGRVADDSIIEARAYGKQNVAILHRHIGFVGACIPSIAEEQRIGCGIPSQAHERIGARESQLLTSVVSCFAAPERTTPPPR